MLTDYWEIHVLPKLAICLVICFASSPADGEEPSGSERAGTNTPRVSVARMLSRYCFDCHGADVQEANIRLDTLDLKDEDSLRVGETLDKVLSVVGTGKMPPDEGEQPTAEERTRLVSWLVRRLDELAHELRDSLQRSRNRRLTVEEYNYTMQALFGVDAEFADMLPPDPISSSGYRNDNARLGLSSLQIEAYLDSARRAIKRYVQSGELDDRLTYNIEFEDLFYATGDRYETRKRAPQPVDTATLASLRTAKLSSQTKYVDPLGPKLPGAYSDEESMRAAIPKLNQQYVAIPRRLPIGEMVVRVRAAGTPDRNGRFPRMRVEAGITLGDGCSIDKRILGEADVTASLASPETFEFRMRLEDVPTKGPLSEEATFDQLSVFDMDQIFISNVSCDSQAIFALGRGGYSDPAAGSKKAAKHLEQMAADRVSFLHLDCIEIKMFPGVGADNDPYRWQIPKVDEREEELAVAQAWIEQFMRAAYRRPVEASEVATKLKLFRKLRAQDDSFDKSVRETMAAVLVSPSFLFLQSQPPAQSTSRVGSITPHQLAARLSYLLWLSPPDEKLIHLADDGSLENQGVLRGEVERLLADPLCGRFIKSFCRQWLRLDKHANVAVDRKHYPKYDDDLAADSIRETLNYFHEVFVSDTSALDLIDSDYAILNGRLAEHYNLDTVAEGGLRKVRLPAESVRGGLLTQASLLTMNSNGIDSHPIRRGVWLLDRLLHDPPPPPPPNVPQIEDNDPAMRGLSLKERIALHRQPGSCQACHEKVDPWGIPFENFDATGRWREASAHQQDGKLHSQPVDSKTVLPNGEMIDGINEFKRYLRTHQRERFANALVHHMLTYALGRPPNFTDRPHVAEIKQRFVASDYRLRELMYAIIESPLFRER